jgi:DNA polymerase-3 subunit delta'
MIRTIVGHSEAVAALNRSLVEDRIAHAYLFTGPPGIGKAALALELARSLNCREPEPPCGVCSTCRRIGNGIYPDVEQIRPGGLCDESDHDHSTDAGRDIRICQVRRAERVLGIAPYEGRRRVLLVDPADTLNAQAADAFLKTLEEPPNGSVLILITAHEEGLAETIRSRCRRVPLRPLSIKETECSLIERFGASPEPARRLARLFGGQLGLAVSALRDPDYEERRDAVLAGAAEVMQSRVADRMVVAERLAEAYGRRDRPKAGDGDGDDASGSIAKDGRARTRSDVFATLDAWIVWWRDVLLVAGGAGETIVNAGSEQQLRDHAGLLGVHGAAMGVQALREARRDLEQNVNARLALEALMLRLPRSS